MVRKKKKRWGKEIKNAESKSLGSLSLGSQPLEMMSFENHFYWSENLATQDLGKEHWRGRSQTFQSPKVRFWHFFFEEYVILIKFSLVEKRSVSVSYTEPDCFTRRAVIKDLIQNIFWALGQKSEIGRIWGVREREKLRITSGFSVLATGWMATSFTGYWNEVGRFLLSLRCFLNPNGDAEYAARHRSLGSLMIFGAF